jgi:hypothetical protein
LLIFFRCLSYDLDNATWEKRAMKSSMLAFALFIAALAPVAAQADDQQGQQACIGDAMTVCPQFIPDRQRVAGCLMSNRQRISASCRAALAHWRS